MSVKRTTLVVTLVDDTPSGPAQRLKTILNARWIVKSVKIKTEKVGWSWRKPSGSRYHYYEHSQRMQKRHYWVHQFLEGVTSGYTENGHWQSMQKHKTVKAAKLYVEAKVREDEKRRRR